MCAWCSGPWWRGKGLGGGREGLTDGVGGRRDGERDTNTSWGSSMKNAVSSASACQTIRGKRGPRRLLAQKSCACVAVCVELGQQRMRTCSHSLKHTPSEWGRKEDDGMELDESRGGGEQGGHREGDGRINAFHC